MNPIYQDVNPYGMQMKEERVRMFEGMDKRLKEQVTAVFCNPHGLQLLDTLDDLYVRQPVCPAGCPEGYGYMREGQNSLILKIRAIVHAAQQVKHE